MPLNHSNVHASAILGIILIEKGRTALTTVIFCIHVFLSCLIWRLMLPQHLQNENCLYGYYCTRLGVVGEPALATLRSVKHFLSVSQVDFSWGEKMQLEPTGSSAKSSCCSKHSFPEQSSDSTCLLWCPAACSSSCTCLSTAPTFPGSPLPYVFQTFPLLKRSHLKHCVKPEMAEFTWTLQEVEQPLSYFFCSFFLLFIFNRGFRRRTVLFQRLEITKGNTIQSTFLSALKNKILLRHYNSPPLSLATETWDRT